MRKIQRLALLVSGNGSTACAIIDACNNGKLIGIEPALVIASEYDIGAIFKASARGVPHIVIRRKDYESQEEFGEALIAVCFRYDIDLVGQYGWMPMTPENFINVYKGRMINQHPGIVIPGREHKDFGGQGMHGMRVHCATLNYMREAGVASPYTEATAQRVDPEYDAGAVLCVERVNILSEDDPKSLQERVLQAEHRVQIKTLQAFADGTVQELSREPIITSPEQIEIWTQSRKTAAILYPKG